MACPCLVHVCWALSLGRHFSFIPLPSPWIHTWDHSPHFFLQSFFYPFPFHFLEHLLYHLKIHINVPQFNCLSQGVSLWEILNMRSGRGGPLGGVKSYFC